MTYVPGNGANKTTGLIATYQNGSDAAYSYTYDDVGNITSITQGTTSISYEYDVANRLTRENNGILNQTITYKYDKYGNIQNKKIYAYTTIDTDLLPTLTPTDTIGYTYNSTGWTDQLTEYNGQTITYDEMGNPTTYRGYTFGWRGKQLTTASNGTNSLTFEYNEDGLRQKKTVNGVDTNYFYNGSVLIGMQRGTSKFLFSYDAAGNVVSVKYITANSTNEYYYLRNAQNDVVKLIDANGTPVVEYTYDTWGKKVTTTGTLAGTLGLFQPFRYRGYVYDWETGFYYLQSRYYDPTVGRFLSADILLSTGQGVLGHNCYAYCLGNPVMMQDPSGYSSDDDSDYGSSLFRLIDRIMETIDNQYEGLFEAIEDNILASICDNNKMNYFYYKKGAPADYYADGIYISFNKMHKIKIITQFYDEYGADAFSAVVAYIAAKHYKKKAAEYHYHRVYRTSNGVPLYSIIKLYMKTRKDNWAFLNWGFLQLPSETGYDKWTEYQEEKKRRENRE